MKRHDKVIFLCTGNTYLSPMAEAIYHEKAPKDYPPCISRGLVVLFSEPLSPKVNILLSKNDITVSDHNSVQLTKKDMTEHTLYLTMTFSEKVKLLEEYGLENEKDSVFTLGEFTGENTDIVDPYGKEVEDYRKCFEDIARRVEDVIRILGEEQDTEVEQEQ